MEHSEIGTDAPAVDTASLLERCQSSVPLARRLATRFLAEVPGQLACIRDALGARDGTGAAKHLHKLRGSLGVLGATAAHDVALRLEAYAAAGAVGGSAELFPRLEGEVERACRALEQFVA
jgi:HPt (histidine-containing phosphotransfer) domain-containing protein